MSNICCACYKCCYNKESACSLNAIAVDKQGRCTLKRFLKSSESCYLDLDAFPTLHSKQILNESAENVSESTVLCKDCEHLMFSDCYGECSTGYRGIVSPTDTCEHGIKRETNNYE